MGDSSASYIRMVQHLIEKCIIFRMTQEECMDALSKYANIKPVITSTVWKELEKENGDFFEAYSRNRQDRMSEAETTQLIQNMLLDSSTHPQNYWKENRKDEEKVEEKGDCGVEPVQGTTTSRNTDQGESSRAN